jgi:stearoyl-CoA 9-desaturase NADPH oxidoreductase
VPERGSVVRLPPLARVVLRVVEAFTSPLRPDDYLELINPLWSTRELRGRIERVKDETADAVTVFITPGFRWVGHRPGQYIRIGLDIEGKRHWRAYSLSSSDSRPDGQITVTVKRVETGVVSSFITRRSAAGAIVTLGEVEGEFTLPEETPGKLLFITAGSGVTPVMAMLESLDRGGVMPDVVHLHSARSREEAIFAADLAALTDRRQGYRLTQRATSTEGRIAPEHLEELCPDWRERETYACGPGSMLEAITAHYAQASQRERLHLESFEHMLAGDIVGAGGAISFLKSAVETSCDGRTPILEAGEAAGATLPFGCRMGICHTCVGMLSSGQVRDLRTGEITRSGTEIRTCVNSAEGPVAIDL